MKKVALKTLGCKVNSYESESMLQMFVADGYVKVDFDDVADVYIINTCTVTNTADRKSRQMIRQSIKKNPEAITVVTGCYTQIASKEVSNIEGVDIILGTKDRNNLLQYIEDYKKEKKQINNIEDIMKETNFEQLNIVSFDSQTRAFIKIQEGCNNFCSFCIIPWARGLMRSQKPERVLSQIEQLVSTGVNEVVLTGIHTGGYGNDLEDYKFADLLRDIDKIEGLNRVRISSIEISQLTDEVLQIIKNSNKIARHLHIPIQSANDDVLKQMKRKYTLDEYKDKINEIRKQLGDISITTDLIVGFPSETDEQFSESLKEVQEIKFSDMHIFPYSKRDGTPAAKMKPQVNEIIKKARFKEMKNLSDSLKKDYIDKNIATIHEVVVEKFNKDGLYEGYTSNYIKVVFQSDQDLLNQIVKVEIIANENGKVIAQKK